jgi:hypothetical protein
MGKYSHQTEAECHKGTNSLKILKNLLSPKSKQKGTGSSDRNQTYFQAKEKENGIE